MTNKNINESTYRIGTVSKLTGIPTETLRVWERRYSLTEPLRSEGGSRLYTQHDLNKLRIIKHLVNNGHAIGTIAHLSIEQLEQRLEDTHIPIFSSHKAFKKPVKAIMVSKTLPIQFKKNMAFLDANKLSFTGIYATPEQAKKAVEDGQEFDILLFEANNLSDTDLKALTTLVDAIKASRVIVVYNFSKQQHRNLLEKYGFTLLRHPLSWDDIIRACFYTFGIMPNDDRSSTGLDTIPARLFTDEQLAEAKTLTMGVGGEYNYHLSELIMSLIRFEEYSEQCKNDPTDDEVLHNYIIKHSSQARNILETALTHVFEIEGISLTH